MARRGFAPAWGSGSPRCEGAELAEGAEIGAAAGAEIGAGARGWASCGMMCVDADILGIEGVPHRLPHPKTQIGY